jgi:predicted nucleotidyltransferase
MIEPEQIEAGVHTLAESARPERILLVGSHARAHADEESDLDLLVIESQVQNRAREMIRLRRALRPVRIPVDVLVFSIDEVAPWGDQPGSALYWALREGKTVRG